MFTGLIEKVGTVKRFSKTGSNYKFVIESGYDDREIQIGESIACDGVCLTVISRGNREITFDLSEETRTRSTLSKYNHGTNINLERALQAGSRLGGHFVSGHVDCVGFVQAIKQSAETAEIKINFDVKYSRLVIEKGSIAVNGISLTVNNVGNDWFSVTIIPHTLKNTNLVNLKNNDPVNLEFDMIGKYVLKINEHKSKETVTMNKLISSGWSNE